MELASCYLKAHMPLAAKEALLQWKARQAVPSILLGGQRREVFSAADQSLAWLAALVGRLEPVADDWAMYGGNPSRNATASEGNPWLKPKYEAAATDDAEIHSAIEKIKARQRAGRVAAVPSLHPLVVGSTVVMAHGDGGPRGGFGYRCAALGGSPGRFPGILRALCRCGEEKERGRDPGPRSAAAVSGKISPLER